MPHSSEKNQNVTNLTKTIYRFLVADYTDFIKVTFATLNFTRMQDFVVNLHILKLSLAPGYPISFLLRGYVL